MAMAQEVLKRRTEAGVELLEFCPTRAMKLYALTAHCDRSLPRYPTPEQVCAAAGLSESTYKGFLQFEPYWSEWLEERRIELGGRSLKTALEAVGVERALDGDVAFWKPLAIREGVISADKLEIGASLPADLGAYKEMKPDDLLALENSVLAALRGEGEANPGEIAMVESAEGWRPESDPGGAAQVPGSLLLDDELGADGESSLRKLESF